MIDREDLEHVFRHTRALWEDVRGTRIFITGGTGFVGTWLVESFVHANRELDLRASTVLLTRNAQAFTARSPHLASDPSIELLEGDITAFDPPAGAFPFVIHAATGRYFEPDAARPLGIIECDFAATQRVLEFARSAGTRRLLFTSSGAVYGDQPHDTTHVDEDYAGPLSSSGHRALYGQSKRLSELTCTLYARQFGFSAVVARLFAFVGPYLPLDEGYAIGNFVRDVLSGGPIRVGGDGTPFRSYLYAADLAIWLWTMLFRAQSCRAYNVGSPEALTIAELAERVAASTVPSTGIEIAGQPIPGTPASRYVPSTARAEKELGLAVRIPLGEGIRRTYLWHRRPAAVER